MTPTPAMAAAATAAEEGWTAEVSTAAEASTVGEVSTAAEEGWTEAEASMVVAVHAAIRERPAARGTRARREPASAGSARRAVRQARPVATAARAERGSRA